MVSHKIFWPSRSSPEEAAEAIVLGATAAGSIAVLGATIALLRTSGFLAGLSNAVLWVASGAFGVLAVLVHRRSRLASILLVLLCFIVGIATPEIPIVIVVFATILCAAAARGTFVLRPNNSLDRTLDE